jgi:hypothetical protein
MTAHSGSHISCHVFSRLPSVSFLSPGNTQSSARGNLWTAFPPRAGGRTRAEHVADLRKPGPYFHPPIDSIISTSHTPGFCKNLFPSLLTAVTTHLCQNSRWNLDVFLAAWKTSILNLEEFGPSFPPGRLLPFNFEHIESGSCSSLPETPHIFLPSIFFFNPVICLSAHLQEKAFISEMPLFKLRLTKAVFRPCFSERVW